MRTDTERGLREILEAAGKQSISRGPQSVLLDLLVPSLSTRVCHKLSMATTPKQHETTPYPITLRLLTSNSWFAHFTHHSSTFPFSHEAPSTPHKFMNSLKTNGIVFNFTHLNFYFTQTIAKVPSVLKEQAASYMVDHFEGNFSNLFEVK
jgi:hypothetical protein